MKKTRNVPLPSSNQYSKSRSKKDYVGHFKCFVTVLVFSIFAVGPVSAADCPPESIRWAQSTHRIYVSGPVECSLTQIDQALSASVPLDLVDPEAKIWFLGANLFLEKGATVLLHGSKIGGDVDEFRLKSNNTSDPYNFAFIRAEWGNVQIKNTRITSWDEAITGPDTEHERLGRAFIHVRSYVEVDSGVARESRMDVIESEVAYLGYYAPRSEIQHQGITGESYGLVWKVQERDLLQVDVHGDIGNSTIHHNYFGMYSYGASGMHIVNNEFYENIQYGLDPHDDSDNLVIEGNNVHHNGRHGIICSKRCDNLLIRYNRSSYNAGHGIVLHEKVVDSVVEANEVVGNLEAGIALFESHNNVVRDNVVDGNKWGIRFREGSRKNVVENNRVYNQTLHGIYIYSGNEYNTVSGNQLSHNGACGAKLIGGYNSAQNNVVKSNKCGFQLGDSSIKVVNNTIVNNLRQGIFCSSSSSPMTLNNIVWGNGDDLDGCSATYSNIEDGDPGEGNISADPIFVDSQHADYRLQAGSPSIDAGTNEGAPVEDMEGSPRALDGEGNGIATTDMGAYESPQSFERLISFDREDIEESSLAEAASKERERKAGGSKPVWVITNANIEAFEGLVSTSVAAEGENKDLTTEGR